MPATIEETSDKTERVREFFEGFAKAIQTHDSEKIRPWFSETEDVSIITLWRHTTGQKGLEEWLAFVNTRGRHLRHEKEGEWYITVRGDVALLDSEIGIVHPDYGNTPLPCRLSVALVREGEPSAWKMLRYHISERSALPRPNAG